MEPARPSPASNDAPAVSLPQFDRIEVASPCSMRWDDMAGDDRRRFCGACRLNVYNLSEMSREDAEALVQGHEGRLCVRFYRRADGTILTRNCPVGLRRVRHAVFRVAGSFAAVLLLGVGALASMSERLRGRSVRVTETEPYVSLTRLLRTPPVAAPAPTPPAAFIMGRVCLPTTPASPETSGAMPTNQAGVPWAGAPLSVNAQNRSKHDASDRAAAGSQEPAWHAPLLPVAADAGRSKRVDLPVPWEK